MEWEEKIRKRIKIADDIKEQRNEPGTGALGYNTACTNTVNRRNEVFL